MLFDFQCSSAIPYAKIGKHGIEGLWLAQRAEHPVRGGAEGAGRRRIIVMNKAILFIREQAKAKKPFLAVIWFHNVHTPLGKNPELMKQYADCSVKEQIYYSNITAVDTQVGALRKALRELGIAENTMVWFTSDNGPLKAKNTPCTARLRAVSSTTLHWVPLGLSGLEALPLRGRHPQLECLPGSRNLLHRRACRDQRLFSHRPCCSWHTVTRRPRLRRHQPAALDRWKDEGAPQGNRFPLPRHAGVGRASTR